ncbi:CopG family ribbon-helix-helix protein [Pseudoduganella namucuonensis]|uniref:Predicted transcriptional regulator n=1 Tax=Pseudoduganella namucuonensis TaxID=1035707 RepID=A0A1I7LKE2_9BURK|nr:ribbon-helix-helix protein, CopG family [Pseudoduganella namucuonensis]SFV10105.1 Predicted transcriptional regulator [Pseudoduganella namucuonensis]
MSTTLNIDVRISDELKAAVEKLAETTGQPVSQIAAQALEDYVGWRTAQLLDLQDAIAAADRGEFADDDETWQQQSHIVN